MQRKTKTISERGVEEEEDKQNNSGQLIAVYDDLESSEFDGSNIEPNEHSEFEEKSKTSSERSYDRQHRSDYGYQSQKPGHKHDLISTGNRLNDMSRIDDYHSKRDQRVNSFLNSFADRSALLEDRVRVFSKDNKKTKNIERHQAIVTDPKEINLITIPEIDPEVTQFEYLDFLNRHNKIKRREQYYRDIIQCNKHLQKYQNVHSTSFQEAKFKFYDRFLPEENKISKNPYKLLKYNQRNKQWKEMLDRLG